MLCAAIHYFERIHQSFWIFLYKEQNIGTLEDNPYLTTCQIQCGQGLGCRPGSVDVAGSSYDRIDHHRKKIIRDSCVVATVIGEMEKMLIK